MNAEGQPVISQPIAVVLIVLILGAAIFMWRQRQLRSRAAWLAIAGVIAVLSYFAFWATPTIG